MINKIVNYSQQSIDAYDLRAVRKTINSGILTQGKEVKNFENNLTKYFSSKYASVVSSGTAALHLTSNALGWKKNDFIVTTPLTFIATANSILYRHATPIFVDTNLDDYQLDLNQLETKLKKNKKIKAVIAIDYAGNPCDWTNLKYLSNKYSFKLINDNCHALGAKYNGQKNYAVKYADVVTQSFHPLKNITTGEGGAILTNNISIFDKVNKLRNHGMESSKAKNYWDKEVKELGFNYRLTEFQAALGTSQLTKVDSLIKKKQLIAKKYNKYFEEIEHIKTPPVRENCYHAYHLYPLLIDFKKLNLDKPSLMNYFLKNNFRLQVHYKPIHTYSLYKKLFKFKNNDFPSSLKFFNDEISLPIFPGFTSNVQSKFIDLFDNFLKSK
jgi:UDP-4-amino-4,6-dideoxy-L-N-acetyl-beta-L-altrosamine transaminase